MSLEEAQRWCETGLGGALALQALEHLVGARLVPGLSRTSSPMRLTWLFGPRLVLSAALLAGIAPFAVLTSLLVLGIAVLHRFDGPYNGGSDRLGLLMLACLWIARASPDGLAPQAAMGYLAVQVVASYALAGAAKVVHPDWRSGRALADVFQFSAYPVSESLRRLRAYPRVLPAASWGVMLLELGFPLALADVRALWAALACAALFHLSAALLFGLNRFFWTWLAAYPALVWFQGLVATRFLSS
jgi:hypothetical protein